MDWVGRILDVWNGSVSWLQPFKLVEGAASRTKRRIEIAILIAKRYKDLFVWFFIFHHFISIS